MHFTEELHLALNFRLQKHVANFRNFSVFLKVYFNIIVVSVISSLKQLSFFQLSLRDTQDPPSHRLNWFKLVGMKTQLMFSAFTECILYTPILEDNIQSFSLSQSYFYSTFGVYCKPFYICQPIEYFQSMHLKQPLLLLLITKSLLSLGVLQRII